MNKKSISKLLSVVCTLSISLTMSVNVSFAYDYTTFEDIENGDIISGEGIGVNEGDGSVRAVKEDSNTVALISYDSTAGDNIPWLVKKIDNVNDGMVAVAFKMKFGVEPPPKVYVEILANDGNVAGRLEVQKRRYVYLTTGDGSKTGGGSQRPGTNEWHDYEIVIDLDALTYGYTYDGVQASIAIPLFDNYIASPVGISGLRFTTDGAAGKQSIYIDDIAFHNYGGVNIDSVKGDGEKIHEDKAVSADLKELVFEFDENVEDNYANASNVVIKDEKDECLDFSCEFSNENKTLTVTLNEALDRNTKYTVELRFTDFKSNKFEFRTEPNEMYVSEYKLYDNGDEAVFRFIPNGPECENAIAVLLMRKDREISDIVMSEVPFNEEGVIKIPSDGTAEAFIIDNFESCTPLMPLLTDGERVIGEKSGDSAKTEMAVDKDNFEINAKAIVPSVRHHQLVWFIINPNKPDYLTAGINPENIKDAVLNCGMVNLGKADGDTVIVNQNLGSEPINGKYYMLFGDSEEKITNNVLTDIYFDDEAINEALKELRAGTKSTLGGLLEYYTNEIAILNLSLSDDTYKAYPDEVIEIMVSNVADCESLAEVEELYLTVCSIVKINNLSGAEKINIIRELDEIFDCDFDGDYKTYRISDETFAGYFSESYEKTDKNSVEAVQKAFRYALALSAVNSLDITNRSKYPIILSDYNDIFKLNLTSNLYKSNSESVYRAFTNKDISTPENIKSCFNTWINSLSSAGGGASSGKSEVKSGVGAIKVAIEENTSPSKPKSEIFNDLDEAAWAADSIKTLYEKNIVSGTGDGSFMPNNGIKREEAVKMIVMAFDITANGDASQFTDVDSNAWYYSYIAAAYASGLIKGTSETVFGTGTDITRADIAVILYRCAVLKGIDMKVQSMNFADSSAIPDYAADAIGALSGAGIINGTGNNMFEPLKSCTRAEFAKMLNSMSELD